MVRIARHALLREATNAAHASLEKTVGELGDLTAYRRYLLGLYNFRLPIETGFEAIEWPDYFGNWRPSTLTALMRADLADLRLPPPESHPPVHRFDFSSLMGTLYVLEGSTLGARLILRDVRQFGLSETYGARHVAQQASGIDNWKSFLSVLDQADGIEEDRMVLAARSAFSAAETEMVHAA